VHAASGKQRLVTHRTCDSEIVPLEQGTLLGACHSMALAEIGVNEKMVIHWEDNAAALHSAEHGTADYAKKRKHIIGMVHSTKEYIEDEDNRAVALHCVTEMMTAELCTKDMHGSLFEFHTANMHGEQGKIKMVQLGVRVCE
jgi:hypothetical protein